MYYMSTRDLTARVTGAQAVARGISVEGGLFVPEALPALTPERLERLCGMRYTERAQELLSDFFPDFTAEEVRAGVTAAYASGRFADGGVAPLAKLSPDAYLLELWHGPTCAFKDLALQLLPHLLTLSARRAAGEKGIVVLAATSGDTGKAALEGFRDVPGVRIVVFYPAGGVSEIQRLQMATQEGGNVMVCGVHGNFDDTQTGVKRIFTDPQLQAALGAHGMMFSSANSINWGRLAPQIVYYVSAYCDLVGEEEIALGDILNVAVPTGNFGNILAAWYAKRMGLPLGKLICASNRNNVLTDFINTGVYDRRRELYLTSSPSMDILISSNLERLLFELHGRDAAAISALMRELGEKGAYDVGGAVREKLQAEFHGGFCGEEGTEAAIRDVFGRYSYLCDPHTAVAWSVYGEYVQKTGDRTKTLLVSTANPYKFAGGVLRALTGKEPRTDEFERLRSLEALTGEPVPQQIAELAGKPVRFAGTCGRDEMRAAVTGFLGIS